MPPLTRQRTLESILSWWSDSNLPGPTINLHGAAKPLMKLMYHRQALEFVKRNHGVPLSPQILEIYWSYLRWKYVSNSTKTAILEGLARRAALEDDVARALEQPDMLDKFLQLVQSPNFGIKLQTIMVLRSLTSRSRSTSVTVCGPVVASLRDSNMHVLIGRVLLLLEIADWWDGTQAILAANVLDDVAKQLVSPGKKERQIPACELLQKMAQFESAVGGVLAMKPCKRLVTLSRRVVL
ncbi:hypothetical protein FB451DRAFT_450610 [Mycena latifolia]|nr:hypothetical protein FB451DRAFT_450610 [Mycena latifolia]